MRESDYTDQVAASDGLYQKGLGARTMYQPRLGGSSELGGPSANKVGSHPDTFRGLLDRMEVLTKKAHSLSGHTRDIRSRVCGSFPTANDLASAPTAVPNGLIEEVQVTLSELESAIGSADADLEHVWAKLS